MGDRPDTGGLALFARFASPPNQRGYCGPREHEALLEYARTGVIDDRLARLARTFDGPLPHLRTLAAAAGHDDPFAVDVVEAYWIGGELLGAVDRDVFAAELEGTFRGQPTVDWGRVTAALPRGVPHHAFHVWVTYPWLGYLDRPGGHAIGVLDACRIRPGRVVSVGEGGVAVVSRPLEHVRGRLVLGDEREEPARVSLVDAASLGPGDAVALHWEWICDRLDGGQLAQLERWSADQLAVVNEVLLA